MSSITEVKRHQIAYGTAAEWVQHDPVLLVGEWGFETDTKKLRIGDGETRFTQLAARLVGNDVFVAENFFRIAHPGDAPDAFTSTAGVVADTAFGKSLRFALSDEITPKSMVPILPGRTYEFSTAYSRNTDSGDPNNDGLEFGIHWYNGLGSLLQSTVIYSDATLFVASLMRQITKWVATAAGDSIDVVAPSGARYARPYIKVFGAGHVTDIHRLALVDAIPGLKGDTGATGATGATGPAGIPTVSLSITIIGASADTGGRPASASDGEGWVTTGDGKVFVWGNATWNEVPSAPSVSAPSIIWPQDFTIPSTALPPASVARTFYVTANGSDSNNGESLSKPVASIEKGLELAAADGNACGIYVYPGEYEVTPDTEIPRNCVLYGMDLRNTKCALPVGAEQNIMFRLTNGCRAQNLTFTNIRHDVITFDPVNENVSPPTTGFAFAFKPGEFITRSPYLSNCSMLHNLSNDQMYDPIDKANGNPLIPMTGGNLLADGSVLDPYTPLRSVVVDSFTAINPNGVGYLVKRNAFVQLVSVFTNWSRVGLWAHEGGHITVANSNNTFGDYALAATGYREIVQIPEQTGAPRAAYPTLSQQILDEKASIIDEVWTQLAGDFPGTVGAWGADLEALTRKDTGYLLEALSNDFKQGSDRATKNFLYGLFNWNAAYVFNPAYLPEFRAAWVIVKARINFRCAAAAAASDMIDSLFTLIDTIITTPPKSTFTSLIEAVGQQLSYAGAGVNWQALPVSQRGTGVATPLDALVKKDGGRLYVTFGTEEGDTFLGEDLRVDFQRSTIEGAAFSRGVQNITLPLIVALGR